MASEDSNLLASIKQWTQQTVSSGWLGEAELLTLLAEDKVDANALFVSHHQRPLIVAFMGGTGVGKSSLLNKLAGQEIAKAGVVRPTSREVTLYHHQSVNLNELGEKFPLQQIQMTQHNEASGQKVIWIDMPDFDSTEKKNKDIVMQWLPYIDVLVYVVSPERYRDNKAWQLLLSQGASHAWLFVMNQWDRGETSQFDDFKQQLSKAGFDSPLIYKTISIEGVEDELPLLQSSIEALSNKNTVEQLEIRGAEQQKNNLKQNLQHALNALGDEKGFSHLLEYQSEQWTDTEEALKQGFDWPIKQASAIFAKVKIKFNKVMLWDDGSQSRFNDYLDSLILKADQQGLPVAPLRDRFLDIRNESEKIIHTETELACRKSLINPGNLLQRVILKLAFFSEIVLPLICMGVVGFKVFEGYYDSAMTGEAFLGVNFMVHSLLLILISWLVPYFITKKMQPSLEKAALKGLYTGLDTAMAMIELDVQQSILALKKQHKELMQEIDGFIKQCDIDNPAFKITHGDEQLQRMLVEDR